MANPIRKFFLDLHPNYKKTEFKKIAQTNTPVEIRNWNMKQRLKFYREVCLVFLGCSLICVLTPILLVHVFLMLSRILLISILKIIYNLILYIIYIGLIRKGKKRTKCLDDNFGIKK